MRDLSLVAPLEASAVHTTNSIGPDLPSNAGGAIWTVNPDPGTLAPWAGFGIFRAYVAIARPAAAALLLRRDA